MNPNMIQTAIKYIYFFIFFFACIYLFPKNAYTEQADLKEKQLALFEEVWGITDKYFCDPEFNGLDWHAIKKEYLEKVNKSTSMDETYQIIKQMLSRLKTSHTFLSTKYDTDYYQLLDIYKAGPMGKKIRTLFPNGDVMYTGIGVFYKKINNSYFIKSVLNGSPAEQAELRSGFEILEADEMPFHPIKSFRSKDGKKVMLKIRFASTHDSIKMMPVVPKKIRPNRLFSESFKKSIKIIPNGEKKIGYAHIYSYGNEKIHQILKEEIAFGRLQNADGIVLDLRDGWGGANPDYLNLFNRNVPVLSNIDRSGKHFQIDFQWRKPVVLLVNDGTRSGKEVIAFGFKKYGIGKVVGQRTTGAVVGGRPFILNDGSMLMLAVTKALVDGEVLEGRGVEPDITVDQKIEYQYEDLQLQKALEVMANALS